MKKIKLNIPTPLSILILYLISIIALILCLKYFTILFAPLFFSFVLAYLFNPVVTFITRKTHISRSMIASILVIILILGMLFATVSLLPNAIERIKHAAERFPSLLKDFSQKAQVISAYLNKHFSDYIGKIDLTNEIEKLIGSQLNNLSSLLLKIFSSIYGLLFTFIYMIFVPLFTYYFLKDYYRIKQFLVDLIPFRHQDEFINKLKDLNEVFSAFIRGQAIVCVILAILYSLGLKLIKFPFPIIIGVFSGLGDIIPYFGTVVGFIISIIIGIAYFESIEKLLLIALVYLVVKGSENWFIYPKIVGRKVDLHFVWIIIAIIVFGHTFGFWGLLVAIPATAGLKLFIADLILYFKRSHFFNKE